MANGQNYRQLVRDRIELRHNPQWWRIENKADLVQVYIYDAIGFGGVAAADFVAELANYKRQAMELHINSPGGDAFDGIAIYNALRSHDADLTVVVDALAASAGSVIAMAGDKVVMNHGSEMMIHDAHGLSVGNAADMQGMGDLLSRLSDDIAGIYAERTGNTAKEMRDLMKSETWFNAEEAVEAGLADEIANNNGKTKGNSWDLSVFNYRCRGDAPAPVASKEPELVMPTFDPSLLIDAIKKGVSA